MQAPKHQRQSPPANDRELRRLVIGAVVQGFIREALKVILREIWRGDPW
jgi:hypothetical protein